MWTLEVIARLKNYLIIQTMRFVYIFLLNDSLGGVCFAYGLHWLLMLYCVFFPVHASPSPWQECVLQVASVSGWRVSAAFAMV